jgi:uncharacterized membrane protein
MPIYTDHAMESTIGKILRAGVTISALLVLAGGLISLRHPWTRMPDYSHFVRERASLDTVSGVFDGIRNLNAASVIQLGILVLIATPVVRVVMCVVGFARQHDRLYVMVSSLVLLILWYSLFSMAAERALTRTVGAYHPGRDSLQS